MQTAIIKKIIGYVLLISICTIVIYTVYKLTINTDKNEGFFAPSDVSTLDLLDKKKSNQIISDLTTASCDSSSITKWSNKLYNMQTGIQLKPISLWKPKLPISGGKTMYKLGDMLSQDPIYAPPSDNALFVSGDVKAPTDYNTILNFKNVTFDTFFAQLDTFVMDINDLNAITTALPTTISTLSTINDIITTNKLNIISALNESIINNVQLGIDTAMITLNDFTSNPDTYSNITPIASPSSAIITIPAGCTFTLYQLNSDNQPIPTATPITLSIDANINSSQLADSASIKSILSSTRYFRNVKSENITFIDNTVNLNNVSVTANLISSMIAKINTEIVAFAKSYPDLSGYLNFDKIIPAIQSFVTTSMAYTYNYPVVKLPIASISNLTYDISSVRVGYTVAPFDPLSIPKMLNSMLYNFDISQLPTFNSSPIAGILNNVGLIGYLANKIGTNSLGLFSMTVLEPVAPAGYMSLGHIFTNQTDNLKTVKANTCVGCVPISCVKEIRDWQMTDMVFEYQDSKIYFNIFYNPYIGTFIFGTKPGLPSGKVCKVVACVKPCTIVDEIIKADKCARNFQQMSKSINVQNPLTSTLVTDEEDQYYLNKIAEQSQRIALLKSKATDMQIQADKVDIVNREYNKGKLQNYVDTQERNIGLVMQQLEKGKNSVDVDMQIPLNVLNYIIKLIQTSDIPHADKKNMLDAIVKNKTLADNGVITGATYRENMSKLLKTCQDYDLNGFVRKDLASEVCYGCSEPV